MPICLFKYFILFCCRRM